MVTPLSHVGAESSSMERTPDEMWLPYIQKKRTENKRVAAASKAKPKAKPKARKSKAEDQELEIDEPEPPVAPPMSKNQRQPNKVSKRKAADVRVDDKTGEQEEASSPECSLAKKKQKSSRHTSRSITRGALKSYQEEDDERRRRRKPQYLGR
jgi:hypothetical protein